MRKPWFQIIEVTEARGRSIEDIASEVARRCRVSIADMRGTLRRKPHLGSVRSLLFKRIHTERPDLSSATVAAFFRCDSSLVRRHWREMDEHRESA